VFRLCNGVVSELLASLSPAVVDFRIEQWTQSRGGEVTQLELGVLLGEFKYSRTSGRPYGTGRLFTRTRRQGLRRLVADN